MSTRTAALPRRDAVAVRPARGAVRGMTLIELLVVVVIVTTLVAGVVPILSPNNDARKIREGARNLHTFIVRTQAEAARTGRPHGIALRETGPDSGFALEVHMLAEPAPFAGFTDYSRVYLLAIGGGNQIDGLQFIAFDPVSGGYAAEPMPPQMLRRGDVVEVDGAFYEITDGDRDGDNVDDTASSTPFVRGDYYTVPGNPGMFQKSFFRCEPVSRPAPLLPLGEQSIVDGNGDFTSCDPLNSGTPAPASPPKAYVIHRMPAATSAPPLTFPRGIGIDLVASGLDRVEFGVETNPLVTSPYALPSPNPPSPQFGRMLSRATTRRQGGTNPPPRLFPGGNVAGNELRVSIMFRPNAGIESVLVNGEEQRGYTKAFLLVGRIENAVAGLRGAQGAGYPAVPPDPPGSDFGSLGADEDEFRRLRRELNWLNADSRWVALGARNGRAIVSENRFVDPRGSTVDFDNDGTQLERDYDDQIAAAHSYAAELTRSDQ
ncbi:MAG: prepilin-type N-terminal cleavage/methylation domain-containing protein [Pirellulales bacterium]|nr:prepilin-type N-terminal cleavage/methylation domain-containing protein [Pirellulales bacterium]